MFIELVDALRCPNQHEESWLVLASTLMEHRHVVSGTLGCPVCAAEYPIANGVVDFRRTNAAVDSWAMELHDDDGIRLAAFLNLTDANGFAVLIGGWGARAHVLSEVVETPIVLVDPPDGIVGAPGISVLRTDGPIPLASSAARGTAVDAASRVNEAVRITKMKARLVAPVHHAVPSDVRELARDERNWVAEREAMPSPPVTLHVRRSL